MPIPRSDLQDVHTSGSRSANRDDTLDVVKGVLVVVMVAYHAMNVFSTAGEQAYGYIRFVSGSFVFVSGYIISRFHAASLSSGAVEAGRRLWRRGFKLVALFTAINILINATGFGNPAKDQTGVGQYIANSPSIYLTGDPRFASFQILLPIGYTLIVAPVLLRLFGAWHKSFTVVAIVAAWLYSLAGSQAPNLEFLIIGVVGLASGVHASGPYRQSRRVRPAVASVGIVVLLLLMGLLSRTLITYVAAIALLLKLLYDLASWFGAASTPLRYCALLGTYSLFAYVAQIVMLQGAQRVFRLAKVDVGGELFAIVAVITILLIGCCVALNRLRPRLPWVDKAYRHVFA